MACEGEDLPCPRAGYRCVFVRQPNASIQWECPICGVVLRDPYLTSCCGTSFCRTCIAAVVEDQKPCPVKTCLKPAFMVMQDKRVENVLKEQQVFCENQVAGCKWQGQLALLDAHLQKDCLLATVSCRYNGCSTRGLRKDVLAHEERCGRRPFRCEHCNECKSTFNELSEHLNMCSGGPTAHAPNQSTEALNVGECKSLQRLEKKIAELETKLKELSKTQSVGVAMEQRMEALEARLSGQRQMISEVDFTQLMERKLSEQRNELEKKLMEQMERYSVQAAGPSGQRAEADLETERRKEFEARITKELEIKMNDLKTDMKKEIEKHVTDSTENRKVLVSLLFKVLKLPVPPIKLEHQLHKVVKVGKTMLHETTFYSHFGGYKLHAQLEVEDLNLKGEFHSKYSVLVKVLCGEFDDCLQWPFEGTLVLSVKKDADIKEHLIDYRNAPIESKSRVFRDEQTKTWKQEIIAVKHPSPQLGFAIQDVKLTK